MTNTLSIDVADACPAAALDFASAETMERVDNARRQGDAEGVRRGEAEYERLRSALGDVTPRSLDGAHAQLVAIDLLLEELAADHDALDKAGAQDRIAHAKAIVERVLAFTAAQTRLPA